MQIIHLFFMWNGNVDHSIVFMWNGNVDYSSLFYVQWECGLFNLQVGMAVNYASGKSLIVLDEFGKGTRSSDGLALLASILNYFISGAYKSNHTNRGVAENAQTTAEPWDSPNAVRSLRPATETCPIILLATHFHSLKQLIPASEIVQYLVEDSFFLHAISLIFLLTLNEQPSFLNNERKIQKQKTKYSNELDDVELVFACSLPLTIFIMIQNMT